MNLHKEVVSAIVPKIYAETAELDKFAVGVAKDMSHGWQCSVMTLELLRELRARKLPSSRELHETSLGWHVMIRHALESEEPSPDDIVTDLTPWQHGPLNRSGPLHGRRKEVCRILELAGAGPVTYALRSFESITIPHTTALTPKAAHKETIG